MLPPPSFFNDQKDTSPTFWCKEQNIKIDNDLTPIAAGFFFKKSKKNPSEHKRIYLCLYKTHLVIAKTKEWYKQYKSLDLSKHFVTLRKLTGLSGVFPYGFNLTYNRKQFTIFSKDTEDLDSFVYKLKKYVITTNFDEKYVKKDKLGAGSYAEVYLIEDKLTHTKYAAKIFNSNLKEAHTSKAIIMNEVVIQRELEHEHIVKLYEVYETDTKVVLVLEYVEGSRLLDYVIKHSPFTEKKSIILMKQLLEATIYLHSKGFIHRDLKLENIMISEEGENSDKVLLKILDFGLSAQADNSEFLKKSGTPGYLAPEIFLSEPYTNKVDVFSLGVVLFTFLSGRSPFVGPDRKAVLSLNRKGDYSMRSRPWIKITSNAKDLVKRMMEMDPNKRVDCRGALEHPWFTLVFLNGVLPVVNIPKIMTISNHHIFLTPRTNSPTHLNTSQNHTHRPRKKSVSEKSLDIKLERRDVVVKSTMETGRSQSTRLFDYRKSILLQNANLLQIPIHPQGQNTGPSHPMLSSIDSNQERTADLSSVDDGINKSSLKSFYKNSYGSNNESSASEMNQSDKRKQPLAQSTTLDQEIARENPPSVAKENMSIQNKSSIESSRKVVSNEHPPITVNLAHHYGSPSLDNIPEGVEGRQTCDITLDSVVDDLAQTPKGTMLFKALGQAYKSPKKRRKINFPNLHLNINAQ